MPTVVEFVYDAPACQWHSDQPFDAEPCITIPKGSTAEYRGHVIGGNIHVQFEGKHYVVHPKTVGL